jgi:hypothetical protein
MPSIREDDTENVGLSFHPSIHPFIRHLLKKSKDQHSVLGKTQPLPFIGKAKM